MKNQALVAAISGLLIGGIGFTNKINFLQVSGFGLLIFSVAVTLTKDGKKTDSNFSTNNISKSNSSPQLSSSNIEVKSDFSTTQKDISKPILKPVQKSFSKPIKQVKNEIKVKPKPIINKSQKPIKKPIKKIVKTH